MEKIHILTETEYAHFANIPNKEILASEIEKISDNVEIITFSDMDESVFYIDFTPCTKISTLETVANVVRANEETVKGKFFIFSISGDKIYELRDFTKTIGETSNNVIVFGSVGENTTIYQYSNSANALSFSANTMPNEDADEEIAALMHVFDTIDAEDDETCECSDEDETCECSDEDCCCCCCNEVEASNDDDVESCRQKEMEHFDYVMKRMEEELDERKNAVMELFRGLRKERFENRDTH